MLLCLDGSKGIMGNHSPMAASKSALYIGKKETKAMMPTSLAHTTHQHGAFEHALKSIATSGKLPHVSAFECH